MDKHGKGYVTQEEFIDWLQDTTYVVFEDLTKVIPVYIRVNFYYAEN